MAIQSIAHQQSEREETASSPTGGSSRILFRFVVVYFALYCFFTQILTSLAPIPNVDWIPVDLTRVPPMRWFVLWVSRHVFRMPTPPNDTDTGSGDTHFDWIALFCLLTIAVVGTAIWIAFDPKCKWHGSVAKWFRVGTRICLAGQMIIYGMDKAIPLQMPFPNLSRLIEPYGNLSPMGVLWASIGSAPAYEVFAGCAELLGGILLFFPRTTMLGALICLADMVQVFMLNMTYDVPVKLLSFHLILLSLVLLAPDFPHLLRFFVSNRATQPSLDPLLLAGTRSNRIAVPFQIAFLLWLLAANAYGAFVGWHTYGSGAPQSPLYGIWDIDQFVVDGQERAALISDNERFRRAIFEYPTRMAFQRMDDSLAQYESVLDSRSETLKLTKDNDKKWKADLSFKRDSKERLTLDGSMGEHSMHMELRMVDRKKFLLVNRGFHWVQDAPFNR